MSGNVEAHAEATERRNRIKPLVETASQVLERAKHEPRDITTETEKVDTGTGSTRTPTLWRFDLIPPEPIRRLALRFAQGAAKHGENNWRKGDWKFVVSCFNHAEDHLNKLKQFGNNGDDNLGAALWNLVAIGWYEVHRREEFNKALRYIIAGNEPV